jgi:hypothetical protein
MTDASDKAEALADDFMEIVYEKQASPMESLEACVLLAGILLGGLHCQKCRASIFKQMVAQIYREMADTAKTVQEVGRLH